MALTVLSGFIALASHTQCFNILVLLLTMREMPLASPLRGWHEEVFIYHDIREVSICTYFLDSFEFCMDK